MIKKLLNAFWIFNLLFLPFFVLSFLAYTVFHQMVIFVGILVCAWFAYYLGWIIADRDRLSREVFLQSYELKKTKEALAASSAVDSQTKVYNERLLNSRLTEECDRARRYRRPLSALMVGLDSLPSLTEHHGSIFSEVVVQEVAHFLKESTRAVDIIIRYGDERFVALLPETQLNQARIVAERVRFAVEKNVFRIEGKEVKVSMSIGFISFDPAIHRTKDDVLAGLDKALAQAKKSGSNRIATLANETE